MPASLKFIFLPMKEASAPAPLTALSFTEISPLEHFRLPGFRWTWTWLNIAWLLETTPLLITPQLLEDIRSLMLPSKLYLYGTYMTQRVCKMPQLQKQSLGIEFNQDPHSAFKSDCTCWHGLLLICHKANLTLESFTFNKHVRRTYRHSWA